MSFLFEKMQIQKIVKKNGKIYDTFLRKYKDQKSYVASGSAATNKVINWKYYK